MADISNLSNYLKDVADAIREKKGTEDQIPAANFDTEILSIEAGIDTSDATAKASDLILNKTAYVNGEKIIGSLKDYRGSGEEAVINYQMSVETNEPSPGTGNPTLEIIGQSMTTGVIGLQAQVRAKAGYSEVAKAIGLTADKLTKGNTILGIEGTAEVGPITQEEYEECLLLSQQILGLVSV